MKSIPITLTDAEWMSLIDSKADGLPACCANISALRDEIIAIAREGRELDGWAVRRFIEAYLHAEGGHEFKELPALQRLIEQVLADPESKVIYDAMSGAPHRPMSPASSGATPTEPE